MIVRAAYCALVMPVEGSAGYMLSLLLLDDGRVVSLDPTDHDSVFDSMADLSASFGERLGTLVVDRDMVAEHPDYPIDPSGTRPLHKRLRAISDAIVAARDTPAGNRDAALADVSDWLDDVADGLQGGRLRIVGEGRGDGSP